MSDSGLVRIAEGARPANAAQPGFASFWAGTGGRVFVTSAAGVDLPVDGRLTPQPLSEATTLTAAHHGRLLTCTGAWTLTVPAAAEIWSGFSCRVANVGGGLITLSGGATLNVEADKSVDLTCDGVRWILSGRDGVSALTPLLTAIGGLTMTTNKLIYGTGANAVALADLTPFGRGLLAASDAAAARGVLGAGTGGGTVTSVSLSVGAGLTGGGTVTTAGVINVGISATSNGHGARTISTAGPSGGANGDIWMQV